MALIRGGGVLCVFTGTESLIITIHVSSCLVFVSFCVHMLLHQPTDACSVLACSFVILLIDLLTCLKVCSRRDTVSEYQNKTATCLHHLISKPGLGFTQVRLSS